MRQQSDMRSCIIRLFRKNCSSQAGDSRTETWKYVRIVESIFKTQSRVHERMEKKNDSDYM